MSLKDKNFVNGDFVRIDWRAWPDDPDYGVVEDNGYAVQCLGHFPPAFKYELNESIAAGIFQATKISEEEYSYQRAIRAIRASGKE